MRYYWNIDVYFILNFILNLFLTTVTGMVCQRKCHMMRILLVSAVVGLSSIATTYYGWGNGGMQITFAVLQVILMNLMAFSWEGKDVFWKTFITFWILAFFVGGIMSGVHNVIDQMAKKTSTYSFWWILVSVVLLFLVFCILWQNILQRVHEWETVTVASIIHENKQYTVKVLYDTGNQLVSPYTGEGVAIIKKELAQTLRLQETQHPVLIPYHSIGGDGILEAYRIDMVICQKKKRKKVLVAVSDNFTNNKEIQMILNVT